MKIAVYHEAPNSIFKKVQEVTSGDYLLSHLYVENETYRKNFQEAVASGRRVIVDNSIFEGKGLTLEEYLDILLELQVILKNNQQPITNLEYIIPDVLESSTETVVNLLNWESLLEDRGISRTELGISIGVVQGKTLEEIVNCYLVLEPSVDKVAISFDYSLYHELTSNKYLDQKLKAWCYGRPILLEFLLQKGIIKEAKPHHLLGCSLSREFGYYSSHSDKFHFIDSIDTSNPVVSGLYGLKYPTCFGLDEKPSMKLCDMIDREVTEKEWELVKHNINSFSTLITSCKSPEEFKRLKTEHLHKQIEENVEN